MGIRSISSSLPPQLSATIIAVHTTGPWSPLTPPPLISPLGRHVPRAWAMRRCSGAPRMPAAPLRQCGDGTPSLRVVTTMRRTPMAMRSAAVVPIAEPSARGAATPPLPFTIRASGTGTRTTTRNHGSLHHHRTDRRNADRHHMDEWWRIGSTFGGYCWSTPWIGGWGSIEISTRCAHTESRRDVCAQYNKTTLKQTPNNEQQSKTN